MFTEDPGIYAITDRKVAQDLHLSLEELVWKLCEFGVLAIQYRDKEVDDVAFEQMARALKESTDRFSIPFIINDRVEIAAKIGAKIVHIGQDDLATLSVHQVKKEFSLQVGVSTHSLAEATAAKEMGADYIAFGVIYSTPTKPDIPEKGVRELARVCQMVSPIPVVAIGGVNPSNMDEMFRNGARAAAMVRGVKELIF